MTWNVIRGCSRVSEGCMNCYAEKMAARIQRCDRGRGIAEGQGSYDGLLAAGGQWNGKITVAEHLLDKPLRMRRPRKIFVNSMSDLFHENLPTSVIDQIFSVMEKASHHTFMILTKRPWRMRGYMRAWMSKNNRPPPKNIWLGVSIENMSTANERIPLLLDTHAAVRWISAEPLLGHVNLTALWANMPNSGRSLTNALSDTILDDGFVSDRGLDWIVVGGESGKNARAMDPSWPRLIRDQCIAFGKPFFFKQWGEFAPNWLNDNAGNKIHGSEWIDPMGKKIAGCSLDGRLWKEFPDQTQESQ